MEHQRREDEIEGRRGIRQLVREPSIESDGGPFSLRLLPRSGERLRIGVEPDYVDVRAEALDQHHQTARATADVENALTRSHLGLLEERSAGSIAADELHERVVERQEPVVAGRGKIRPSVSAGSLRSSSPSLPLPEVYAAKAESSGPTPVPPPPSPRARRSRLLPPHAGAVFARPRVGPLPTSLAPYMIVRGVARRIRARHGDLRSRRERGALPRPARRNRLGGAAVHHLWPHDADAAARGHVRTRRLPILGHRASVTPPCTAARGDSPARRGRHGPRVQLGARESLSRWLRLRGMAP